MKGIAVELQDVVSNWHDDRSARRLAVDKERLEILRRTQNLYSILEDMGRDTPNLEDLTRRLRENNAKLGALEAQIERIDAEEPPPATVTVLDALALSESLIALFRNEYNAARTRGLLSDIIGKIVFGEHDVVIEYSPISLLKTAPGHPYERVPSKIRWLPEPTLLGTKTVIRELPQRVLAGA